MRQKIAQTLEQVRQQAPILGQLKTAAPEAYATIQALIQGVIAMARALAPAQPEQSMQKAEAEEAAELVKETCDYTAKSTKERCKNPRTRKVAGRYLCHHHADLAAKDDKKAETAPLTKALGDMPVGKDLGGSTFPVKGAFTQSHDYTHLLKPEHQQAGYKLQIHHDSDSGTMAATLHHAGSTPAPGVKKTWHSGDMVGSVVADTSPVNKNISVSTTSLDAEHRGKGVGMAMYEGLFAHAKNHLGLRSVIGGDHSTMASAVHTKLAQKHGMDYKAEPIPERAHVPSGQHDAKVGPYSYALKAELPMEKGALPEAKKPPTKHPLVLPPGSIHEGGPGGNPKNVGKVKIKHGDGSTSWISARSGQVTAVADRQAQPLLGQASHPLSSRNPAGH